MIMFVCVYLIQCCDDVDLVLVNVYSHVTFDMPLQIDVYMYVLYMYYYACTINIIIDLTQARINVCGCGKD